MKKRLILIAFLLLLVGAGGLVYWGQHTKRASERYYSGMIEATQANLAFQTAGRIKRSAGGRRPGRLTPVRLLAVLDQDSALANREQALANLMRAESTLKQMDTLLALNRQALPAEVEKAEAAVQALQAQLAGTGNRIPEPGNTAGLIWRWNRNGSPWKMHVKTRYGMRSFFKER